MGNSGVSNFNASMLISYLLALVFGYICGATPFGYLVAKNMGVNILEKGSKNIGATNVSRVLGKKPGILVFVLDLAKGALGVILASKLLNNESNSPDLLGLIAGVGAILGHNFTFWLKFKGGKGIATTSGVLLGLTPWTFLILISTWGIIFKLTRYVSVASILAAFLMPFIVYFIDDGNPVLVWSTAILGALAIVRHKANIVRLLNGTENRFEKKGPTEKNSEKNLEDAKK